MSDGVFIISKSGLAANTLIAVITIVTAIPKIILVATERLTPFSLPAPNLCAVITAKPLVTPCTNPTIKNEIEPVAPTAASASTLIVLPTIIVSAIL